MLKIDLSKLLSRKLVSYSASVIPGLFFEASVAVGAPSIAHHIIDNLDGIYPFPPYALFALFIAAGFVFGQAFIQLAWIAELILNGIHQLFRFGIRVTFGSPTFYKWLGKLHGNQPNRNWWIRSFQWAVFAAKMPKRYEAAKPAMRCLGVASKELLKRRYGIDVADSLSPNGKEWNVWYSTLGKPIPVFSESITVIRTSLGCGLAGFLASVIAPNLHTRYFFSLCSVFTANGLYMTWILFRWRTDPVRLNHLRLQEVMLELAEVGQAKQAPSAENGDDGE